MDSGARKVGMNEPLIVVIPCRAGSERVKNKNTRPFAGFKNGLLELKLKQLARVRVVDKVIVSTNDPIVYDYTAWFGKECDHRVVAVERPDELGRSSTPMSEFIKYSATLSNDGTMVMTHVTHPFVNSDALVDVIEKYKEVLEHGYDSLFTVTRLHKFIWDDKGPYNYDNSKEKWPRSQDIKPLFEVNHAAYVMSFELMRKMGDRVGRNPYLYEIQEKIGMDIDWEEQFELLNDIALAQVQKDISLL